MSKPTDNHVYQSTTDKGSARASTRVWRLLQALFAIASLALFWPASSVIAAELNCEADSRITETFSNGASWELCWESRIRENLVLSDVHYTPAGGEPLRVLSSARLSQLHVAYDDSNVTYNDVTQYGLGGGYLLSLTDADCPNGELLDVQTRPAICRWRSQGDAGYRTASRTNKAESLNLFSVSQVGAYAYIISWTFYDDGAIEPGIGATGALQRSSSDITQPYGRVLQNDSDSLWLSHTHNYYWRLDFDLGESATDDQFSETRYVLQPDGTRVRESQVFTTEQARQISPETQQSWQISATSNENSPAYRIEPVRLGHRFERTDIEPYSDYDMFVTVANECERFASQNARFNPDCLNHVLQYVDDQSIEDQDIVLWHRVGFHHVPRSEDQRNMHTHWDGFVIQPQNVLPSTSSLPASSSNSPPVLLDLIAKQNNPGDAVHGHLSAEDPDNDILTFTASGLPTGVRMNTRGHLQGETSTAGNYTVTVDVRDDHYQVTSSFDWKVGNATSGSSSKGGGSVGWLMLFAGLVLAGLRNTSGQPIQALASWVRAHST
ncbi:putative Ig domain-containing protein [Granulosicoccus antarcticus]|uniref:copper amine oxidase n=1 Tax=Granulosicoccus antarcticus TaxID=437505 RepID=UPI0012FE07C8|nr:putative Ig domain-containing protein [Granulosicoccus antarcticus]